MGGILTILLAVFAALAAGCGSPSATQLPATAPVSAPAGPALETLRLDLVLRSGEGWLEAPTNFVQAPGRPCAGDRTGWGDLGLQRRLHLGAEHVFYTDFLDIRDRVNEPWLGGRTAGAGSIPEQRKAPLLLLFCGQPTSLGGLAFQLQQGSLPGQRAGYPGGGAALRQPQRRADCLRPGRLPVHRPRRRRVGGRPAAQRAGHLDAAGHNPAH